MNVAHAVEALLFASSRPLPIKRLAKLANCSVQEVNSALGFLAIRYKDAGVWLQIKDGKAQLLTSPQYQEIVKGFTKKVAKRKITAPAIEVLAIVAAKGETSISQISKYRGTHSEAIVDGLVKKGLLESHEHPSHTRKRKIVYRITDKFRSMAGISGIEQMKAHVTSLSDDEPLDLFDLEASKQETMVDLSDEDQAI